MTNEDGSPPASSRVPDPLVMPFANVRHLATRGPAEIAALSAGSLPAVLDAAGVTY